MFLFSAVDSSFLYWRKRFIAMSHLDQSPLTGDRQYLIYSSASFLSVASYACPSKFKLGEKYISCKLNFFFFLSLFFVLIVHQGRCRVRGGGDPRRNQRSERVQDLQRLVEKKVLAWFLSLFRRQPPSPPPPEY